MSHGCLFAHKGSSGSPGLGPPPPAGQSRPFLPRLGRVSSRRGLAARSGAAEQPEPRYHPTVRLHTRNSPGKHRPAAPHRGQTLGPRTAAKLARVRGRTRGRRAARALPGPRRRPRDPVTVTRCRNLGKGEGCNTAPPRPGPAAAAARAPVAKPRSSPPPRGGFSRA